MKRAFIILAWRDATGRARACDLARRHDATLKQVAAGLDHVVLANPGNTITSGSPAMVVLGTLHGGSLRPCRGAPLDQLRALIARNWGSYLAFTPDAAGDHHAMVDPSGAGRAYMARDRHLSMITDRLDATIMHTAGFDVTVDAAAVAGCLLDPGTMVTAPLLHGVVAMVPGTAYALSPQGDVTELWSPATSPCRDDGGDALRDEVDRAVQAMCGSGRPLIELSGGLDSSIIAGTMAACGIEADAVTVETIGGDVDELRYARTTAGYCRLPLHQGRTDAYPDYAAFMEAEQVAHPYLYGVDDAFARVVAAAAGDADQIVTGQGGDAVFFQPATPLTTVDRVRALGVRSGWQALLDDARRTRASIWHHLLPAISDRLRPIGLPQDELAGNLLTRCAREERRRFLHPWCIGAHDLPPGRQLQILMLANSLVFHSERAVELGRPLVHPLLSQPVLEAALAIPTWRLASGSFDRGLVRGLFADRLHPDIIRRRSKGEAAAFYSRAAVANLPYLRERLLGGALAKAEIIDIAAMEQALTTDYLFHSLDYRALILHAACEAWLSAWLA